METGKINFIKIARTIDIETIKSHPILDIAARFWEPERYEAAKICYYVFREIDDLIDNRKAEGSKITDKEKIHLEAVVKKWVRVMTSDMSDLTPEKKFLKEITKFQIPARAWESFGKSMLYDIYHEGFKTFSDFLSYAEGACVAPASIFIHFCGCTKKNDTYDPPCFDIFKAARPISIFSYLVHIIRDFKKDHYENLNYFTRDLLKEMGVKPQTLNQAARGVITKEFRWLINRYKVLINQFKIKSRNEINR